MQSFAEVAAALVTTLEVSATVTARPSNFSTFGKYSLESPASALGHGDFDLLYIK